MRMIHFGDLIEQGKVAGRRVFIRSDLNVPLDEGGKIVDDTRIRSSLQAIEMARAAGAAVMVTSHLGRPKKGAVGSGDSLKVVATRLSELLETPVKLIRNWLNESFVVDPGEVVLLENCRCIEGEVENDDEVARKMAALTDIYVNDAFGTAHRKHATTYGMAEYVSLACAGPLLLKEVEAVEQAINNPKRPLVAIVGGSKVSSKLNVLHQLATFVDGLIVGGGMANTFLLASGAKIGLSLAEPELLEEAKKIMDIMAERGASIPLPVDVVTAKEFSESAKPELKAIEDIQDDDMILDVGPHTSSRFVDYIQRANMIVWNGPIGVFEYEAFSVGTKVVAEAIAASDAYTLAGGGDTIAAMTQFGISHKIDYISTGGGAFLEMLEGKTLPAVEVLNRRAL